jgi:hypothetical protein
VCICYSNTRGVTTLPPLKKLHLEITKEERSSENKERSLNHFFDLSSTKVGLITFLILGSRTCLLSVRIADGNKLQGGVSFDDPSLAKRMNKAFEFPCETTRTRIDDNQDSKECTWSE